ncbi:MAG: type II CRISPR-associated endonuclease Cas1 [Bacteroidales bacterium]|nr:type II CRISPR-associated endonuclease Cas1 [Bacteroidales bacterium]
MIKRTLYFGNPAYLKLKNEQLVINLPDAQGFDNLSGANTIPIEDIGIMILDNKQLTITQALLQALLDNNISLICCGETHMPEGLFLPLSGNKIQHERFRDQIDATKPLCKQLWQQTVKAKILNQASNLILLDVPIKNMKHWAKEVQSADAANHEARAAAYYWPKLFGMIENFKRGREEAPPNNLLNYGYAILRAITARSLVASGLLPTLGIHHDNKYNAYCLADDIMEPYRPYVDALVYSIVESGEDFSELSKSIKTQLLSIPTLDVVIQGKRSPLMVAMQQTTTSVYKCFSGEARKIVYPLIHDFFDV